MSIPTQSVINSSLWSCKDFKPVSFHFHSQPVPIEQGTLVNREYLGGFASNFGLRLFVQVLGKFPGHSSIMIADSISTQIQEHD